MSNLKWLWCVWLGWMLGCTPSPGGDGYAERPCTPAAADDTTALDIETRVAFVDANVIAMNDGSVLEHRTVVIEDGIIKQIGLTKDVVIPDDMLQICATDRFLMPGLTDMHVHFNFVEDGLLYVANGVTTVRNMFGQESVLEMRDQFASKQLLGPRLITASPIIDGDSPTHTGSTSVTTAEEAATAVANAVQLGYDEIKVYDGISVAAYNAIVATAAQHEIPVAGHVPDSVGLAAVVNAGQKSIEHFDNYDPELNDGSQEQLTAASDVWNCGTLITLHNYENIAELQANEPEEVMYVAPELVDAWRLFPSFTTRFAEYMEVQGRLHQAGAALLIGTDASNGYVVPGFSLHQELALAVQAGLSPYEALKADTIGTAQYLGELTTSGTVEAGKRADLLLLDANPLADIRHTRAIAGVMVNGSWYQQARLQQQLDELAAVYAAKRQ